VPRYARLRDAMDDIEREPAADEVIEIVDSAIYTDDLVAWPSGPRSLMLQASEGARPVLHQRLQTWNAPSAPYQRFAMRGISFGSEARVDPEPRVALRLPSASEVDLAFCTVTTPDTRLELDAPPSGARMTVRHCLLGALHLDGAGTLAVRGSVLDVERESGQRRSITAPGWAADVDRSTIFGRVEVRVLEASESIVLDQVTVIDRFHGCIRYCRVEPGSVLPRQHRVEAGAPVLFVSLDRNDPAYARLSERCPPAILRGAADGGELGAFHDTLWSVRHEALRRRLTEFTPAGLETGVIRID